MPDNTNNYNVLFIMPLLALYPGAKQKYTAMKCLA